MCGLLLGCRPTPPERPADPDYGTVPTDTVPQFRGWVPRNLIMISIDTFRKDHLDRYGDHEVTPFLTYLADSGMALDDFVQCSNWTFASTSCTLAGRYNVEAGMGPALRKPARDRWPEGTPFLATSLRDHGFYNILVSTNGWLSQEWGNTQGYHEAFHPYVGTAESTFAEGRTQLERAIARGVADRWFLHIHLVEPHAPYAPPERYLDETDQLPDVPYDLNVRTEHYDQRDLYRSLSPEEQQLLEQHLRTRYRAEMRYLDDQIFSIFQDLEGADLLDDAMLMVWTDHGEAFWEHGFHTHAYTHHGEETDAVALLWSKNIVTQAYPAPTSSIDLAPTLLHLWDLPVPEHMTGVPLGTADTTDRPRFTWSIARLGTGQSVQQNGFKLTYNWNGTVKLYDRNIDPLETTDLFDRLDPGEPALSLWETLRPVAEEASAIAPDQPIVWPSTLP